LERRIPESFTKLAFIDADILFDSPDWYRKTSELLETHDVVQPFSKANWLDLTYRSVFLTMKPAMMSQGVKYDTGFHAGFAWAFRREWYRQVGFYDYALIGAGDAISFSCWLKKTLPEFLLKQSLVESYSELNMCPSPRITYLQDSVISHLFHGSIKNRQYENRGSLISGNDDIRNLIYENTDGVYEWKNPSVNDKFLTYFKNRNDDGV